MLKSIATWVFLAVAAVQAVPTPVDSVDSIDFSELDAREIGPRAVQSGLANFERLDTSGLGVNDIGYYGGLQWNGIAAIGANNGGALASIRPHSPPNVAAYGVVTRLLSGSPNITAKFTGSKTSSFSVSSFYFGCVAAVLTGPVGCKVAMAGYDTRNILRAYQASYFNPTNTSLGSVNSMQLMRLSSNFTGLAYIKFATQYVGLDLTGSTVFDDFRYTITTTT